jgi:hypothetical protein
MLDSPHEVGSSALPGRFGVSICLGISYKRFHYISCMEDYNVGIFPIFSRIHAKSGKAWIGMRLLRILELARIVPSDIM